MLVALHQPRLALASGTHLHRKDLAEEKALLQRSLVARLGRSGETVGVFAGDAEGAGHVVAGLRHAVVAIALDQPGVGEARADGAVEDLQRAAEGALRLGHDERRPGHAFGAAGQVQPTLAATDRARRVDHRRQSAGTQAVDRLPGQPRRQAGCEQRVARQVAAVFAGLVGATEDHILQVVDGEPGGFRETRQQQAGQVVRTHRRECTGMPAERRTQAGVDIGIEHGVFLREGIRRPTGCPAGAGKGPVGRAGAARGWGDSAGRR